MKKYKIILLVIGFAILAITSIYCFLIKPKPTSFAELSNKEKLCSEQLASFTKFVESWNDDNKSMISNPVKFDNFVVGYSQKLDSCIGGYSEGSTSPTYIIVPEINMYDSGTIATFDNKKNEADVTIDLENAKKFKEKFNELTNGLNTGILINTNN